MEFFHTSNTITRFPSFFCNPRHELMNHWGKKASGNDKVSLVNIEVKFDFFPFPHRWNVVK
jgi:hypothetical protein